MDSPNVPSRGVIAAVEQYRDLLMEHGPDSPQARQFFEKWKHMDQFEENARQQYDLAKEDYEELRAAHAHKRGQ